MRAEGAAGWWAGEAPTLEWWRPAPRREPVRAEDGGALSLPDFASSRVAFWGVMAFTFVLLISPQTILPALKPLRLAFLAAIFTAATVFVGRLSHGRPLRMTREVWIVAALALWSILMVPSSYWPGGSLHFLLDVFFKSLAIFWLLANTLDTPTRIRRLTWALAAMAAPLALTGVRHFASGVFYGTGLTDKRIVGYEAPLTENPNDLALMLNLLLPLAVALLLMSRRPRNRLILMAVIGLDVAGIISSFSRAGFLTLGVVFLVYVWKFRGRPAARGVWGILALLVVVMLAGLPLAPRAYLARLDTITNFRTDPTGSAQARWNDNWAALRLVSRHPIIGAGANQNVLALNRERGKRWTEIHNVYLEYAVDLGLPGLVLFLMLLRSCFRSVRLVQRESAGRPEFGDLFCLAEGVEVSLIAFAVGATFHPVAYHFYFFYIAGLAVALRETWRALAGARSGAGDSSPAAAG